MYRTPSTIPIPDVSIIGGAIAGPAAALHMALSGHAVTVYEQRPADALFSAGILGLTPGNWAWLTDTGVDLSPWELPNGFEQYGLPPTLSPFRYLTWTGLHRALVSAASARGARFVFGTHVLPSDTARSPLTVEATGVAGAARLKLPHRYSGYTIYRGLSRRSVGAPFITVPQHDRQYLTVGDTPDGAFWAYFVSRPGEPATLRTTETDTPPVEYLSLPDRFIDVLRQTATVAVSPLSDWHVPDRMMAPGRRYIRLGDVNGPVRPVTTSGANLAVMEGFSVGDLLGDAPRARVAERIMLRRRQFDLDLGAMLEVPEIGGAFTDPMFASHHMALFPGRFA